MSKIFYDHLIVVEKVNSLINKVSENSEEKVDLWNILDEIIHTRILLNILDNLHARYHHEFLTKFHACPYDENLLDYLDHRMDVNLIEIVTNDMKQLEKELTTVRRQDIKNN